MKYLVIFKDCFQEALDRKLLYVLLSLSLLLILWCAALRFQDAPPEKLARSLAGEVYDCAPAGVVLPPLFMVGYGPNLLDVQGDAVSGLRFRVEVEASEFLRRVAAWRVLEPAAATGLGIGRLQERLARLFFRDLKVEVRADGSYEVKNAGERMPLAAADLEAYFVDRLKRVGMDAARVRLADTGRREFAPRDPGLFRMGHGPGHKEGGGKDGEDDPDPVGPPPPGPPRPGPDTARGPRTALAFVFDVEARGTDERELRTVERVGILFGLASVDVMWVQLDPGVLAGADATMSRRLIVALFQRRIVEWVAGFIAVAVALVVTGSFIPDMLRRGTIDLLLSKPIRRPLLLVYKYLGGLTFVFLNAVFLIGGTWLALGLSSGWFNPWYLATILVVTFFFAVLYAVSTLVAVVTRSTVVSILLSVAVWFVSWVISVGHKVSLAGFDPVGGKETWQKVIDVLYFVAPKTGGMNDLNNWILAKAFSGGSLSQTILLESARPDLVLIVGTSLGFIAIVIGLAAWRFTRRDY